MDNRIQRYAKVFRLIFVMLLVATPLVVAGMWLGGGGIHIEGDGGRAVFELVIDDFLKDADMVRTFPLPWDVRLLALAVGMIPAGVFMLGMWWLVRLFGLFSVGQIFTADTVRYIRHLGWTMVAGVAAAPVHEALLSLVLTMHNPPGEHILSLSTESADLGELLTAGVIILVSWIMDEGRKLREADELTV